VPYSASVYLWIFLSQAGFAVILIFSVQGSGQFQGFARFLGHTSAEKLPELQTQGQGSGSGIQVNF
jgi:hypothetical protein